MSHRYPLLAVAVSCAVIDPGAAQEQSKRSVATVQDDAAPDIVTLRAVHPNLPNEIVRLVAESAAPTRFDAKLNSDKRARTPRQIAVELCGSVNNAYFDAWRQLNGTKADGLDIDAPALDSVYALAWPACLYVSDAKGSYTVLKDDNVPRLYKIFTGSDGSPRSWSSFFAGSRIGANNAIDPGQQVTYNWITRPVRLTLTIPKDVFSKKLDDALSAVRADGVRKLPVRDFSGQTVYANIPIAAGDAFEDAQGRISYADARDCAGMDKPPFDPARLAATYRFLRTQTGSPNPTRILVVDNGFFGARKVGKKAQFGPAFSDAGTLFLTSDPEGIIGPALKPGPDSIIYPLNYENDLTQPDERSGHGTHVLGLALGGPGFDRSLFQGWLSVAVVAVSKGKDELDGLSVSDIITAVGKVKPRLVNMSIEYSKNQTQELLQLMVNNPKALFVVAAGNGSMSVEDQASFPAMLADQQQNANILVVAATKGPDQPLAAFSNFSEEKVGTAAPGCRIRSWIGEADHPVRMSGTSQATPIVTFASALVNSIMDQEAPPEAIRYRIQASGDPSPGDAQTQVQTVANAERALYLNFDYVSYQPASGGVVDLGAPPIELLGELRLVPTWKPCVNIGGDQTWSFAAKPTDGGPADISVITGYQEGVVTRPRPCRRIAPGAGKGRVQFRATWKLNGTEKPDAVTDTEFMDIDIRQLNRFIRKGPGARTN